MNPNEMECISCLTVTQPTRYAQLQQCVRDFDAQSYPNRELLIVHDGGERFHAAIEALAGDYPQSVIRVHQAPAGLTLGTLRNLAVKHASGDLVCQWDDDDRYHPLRLQIQHAELRAQGADFCFLMDQLHWFPNSSELYWDNWEVEAYPINFIPGTLLGRRDKMPQYPDARMGEDSAVVLSLLRANCVVARVRQQGWCYAYVYHGSNTFGMAHHRAISRLKGQSSLRMMVHQRLLKQRLSEYRPPFVAQ
ncbi:MAG: glycosyltransferase family 2 protein [Cupriavidus sp.]|nr:MAG: glycosyltransferase family 2 protein [Cupriavidus sp.]